MNRKRYTLERIISLFREAVIFLAQCSAVGDIFDNWPFQSRHATDGDSDMAA